MKRLSTIKFFGILLAGMALGFAAATAVSFWGKPNSPQFYGALSASLIAAAGLIFNSIYNDFSIRRRDAEATTREKTAAAIDLHFWLDHCATELDFIASALARLHKKLTSENKPTIDFSLEQFKEMLSSHFYEELLDRAKAASKLPPEMAGFIASKIYEAHTTADRIFGMNHASERFLPPTEQVDQYAKLVYMQKDKLKHANSLLGEYLIQIRALPRFPAD